MFHIKITSEQKQLMISRIQQFFLEERGEEIGELAAENAYQFFVKELGPFLYNQGIQDARIMAEQKLMGLDEDIRSLEKTLNTK
ncbi:DUF2164 domain-containing protein [Salinibacillus xinjiangensis]|uniref:DUF2164 family protein n=1 Tax=Salinibacillus xinjiangensis TaxID=1229268 RepID=A0A6G1X4E6_9BACI|nr:DUF2164 domain-containing protein [Salinibacillus xinjiangensis]MRG85834.1 DUF2164 family protein [Salinibacillus xinjiangensis]